MKNQNAQVGRRRFLAGIDIGTSKVGLAILNARGQRVWSGSKSLPKPSTAKLHGLVTQDINAWFLTTTHLLAQAGEEVPRDQIAAIAATATTPTYAFLGRNGKPFVDEAVMWTDQNADGTSNASGTNLGLRKLSRISELIPNFSQVATILDAPNLMTCWLTWYRTKSTACLARKMAWCPSGGFDTDGIPRNKDSANRAK